MHPIQHSRKRRNIIQQLLKMLNRLFLRHLQTELSQYLFMYIAMFDMRDVRIYHEGNQVENEVGGFAEDGEGGETEVFEAGIVDGLDAAHGVYHFFADFDGRGKWFGVSA